MSRRGPQRKRRNFKSPSAKRMTKEQLIEELESRKPEWTPFVELPPEVCAKSGADSGYENSRYMVWIYKPDNPKSDRGDWNRKSDEEEFSKFLQLSIKDHDKTVMAHDWRDMMRIKNELVHRDAEAFELYPAMKRVCDEANQFHLWVLLPDEEGGDWPTITAGWDMRLMSRPETALKINARQRKFEEGYLNDEDIADIEWLESQIEDELN